MGKLRSFRSRAARLVSGLTTVLLNPISDKPSDNNPSSGDEEAEGERNLESVSVEVEDSETSVNGPDTSSFTAFLYSLLKDDYFTVESEDGQPSKEATETDEHGPELEPVAVPESVNVVRESGGKRGLFSRGKQSLGKAMNYAARLALFRSQASERKPSSPTSPNDKNESKDVGEDLKPVVESKNENSLWMADLPDMTEASVLLSLKAQGKVYASLPALVRGKKWVLLYSTRRHGISLSTLYRRSALCPGLSLLVVGDRRGAVFGGVVEAPLNPCKSRRYQGSNSTFLFSDARGEPVIYRPTGANRYYTLCSPDFLALGGGLHFALYLDNDLQN